MKSLRMFLLISCYLFSTLAFANPTDVSFSTRQGVTLTGKLYLPVWSSALVPAVVMMHGCAGIYSYSDPAKGLALLYKEWGERLARAGYAALVVDSFSGRNAPQNQCGNGRDGVSEVTDRPYDAQGAWQFLKTSYSSWVDPAKVVLLGWSHGGSSTLSTLSDSMISELGKPFKAGFAFYPGCGLYGAFGGISTSTYVPYSPLHILHAGNDPLYTSGYCDTRISNAEKLGSTNMSMVVYPGAQHNFDNARMVDSKWTQADVDAKAAADAFVMQQLDKMFSAPASPNPADVSFSTRQGITLTGKLYLPAWSSVLIPAVVMMHGCAGIYSYSDPAKGLALLYKEWGDRLVSAGYAALVVDSFSGRNMPQNQCGNGRDGVSEVTDRPYDAQGAWQFLKTSYLSWVDPAKVVLLGWSHGGSSTFSTLSDSMISELGKPFKAGFAFYPGCGLYGAFGGISTSTYVPYSPLHILHAGNDPLYTSGYCDTRISNAEKLGSTNMSMTVYPGAQHNFDNARMVDSKWTQADVDAKAAADAFVMQQLNNMLK